MDLGTALAYWTDPQDPEELQEIRSAPTTLPGTLTRAQLVERYAVATGRDPGDMTFYLTFSRFKVAVIIQPGCFCRVRVVAAWQIEHVGVVSRLDESSSFPTVDRRDKNRVSR